VGLPLCAKDALEGMDVKVDLGQQPLELAVLQLQLKLEQPLGIACVHAAVLGSPFLKRRITEAEFAPDLLDRHAGLGLLQKKNDLLFTEFACSHIHHSPS